MKNENVLSRKLIFFSLTINFICIVNNYVFFAVILRLNEELEARLDFVVVIFNTRLL